MITSKGLGDFCHGEERKDVYSEQDVNNALLMKYEATDRKDCFRDENQVEFSKGEKNVSWAIICACLSPEFVDRPK